MWRGPLCFPDASFSHPMSEPRLVRIDRLELAFAPRPWPFADKRRAEIDAHFARLRAEKPALWNGRVLLLRDYAVAGATLHGACFETDFASFIAWRDWGFPDPDIRNCFAMGALRARDGAFLLGVMAEQTANAGRIYFPSGTPDAYDIVDGTIDLEGSVRRELAEETGVTPDEIDIAPDWRAVFHGPRIALIKTMRSRETAEELRARILDVIAGQAQPELADIRIARGPADIDPMMPDFVTAFLADAWRGA